MITKKQQDDIDKHYARFSWLARLMCKLEMKQLNQVINPEDSIEGMVYGMHRGAFALLVATDERLFFIDKRLVTMRVDEFQFQHIESMQYDFGVAYGMIKVTTANKFFDLKLVPNRMLKPFVMKVNNHAKRKIWTDESSNFSATDMDELERLSMLHRQGDLSDQEFTDAKTRIINRR